MHSSFLLTTANMLVNIIAKTADQPAHNAPWSLQQILFLLGIIALSFFMVRSTWKRVLRSQKKSQVPINQRIRQRLLLEKHYDQVNELMAALAELSRQINGQLDTRMAKLEILLSQAQATVTKLEEITDTPQNNSIPFHLPQDKISTYVNEISALINDISDTNDLAEVAETMPKQKTDTEPKTNLYTEPETKTETATETETEQKQGGQRQQRDPKNQNAAGDKGGTKSKNSNSKISHVSKTTSNNKNTRNSGTSYNAKITRNSKVVRSTKNKPKRKAPAQKSKTAKTKSNISIKTDSNDSQANDTLAVQSEQLQQNKQSQQNGQPPLQDQEKHTVQNANDNANGISPENMEVAQLFQRGLSKIDIAERLSRPVGEIELILNLIKNRER